MCVSRRHSAPELARKILHVPIAHVSWALDRAAHLGDKNLHLLERPAQDLANGINGKAIKADFEVQARVPETLGVSKCLECVVGRVPSVRSKIALPSNNAPCLPNRTGARETS